MTPRTSVPGLIIASMLIAQPVAAVTAERLGEIEAEVRRSVAQDYLQKSGVRETTLAGISGEELAKPEESPSIVKSGSDVRSTEDLVTLLTNAIESNDLELVEALLPLLKSRTTSNSGSSESGSEGSCPNGQDGCSDNLKDEANEVEALTADLDQAAEDGDVSEFKRVLAKIRSKAATTLPRDVGWGKGTRSDAAVASCVNSKLTQDLQKTLAGVSEAEIASTSMNTTLNLSAANKDCQKKQPEHDADFFLGLYGGVEGASLSDINDEAVLRVGLNAYQQLMRFQPHYSTEPKASWIDRFTRCKDKLDCGFGFGLHGWFNLLLTSSGEQSPLTADDAPMVGMMPEQPATDGGNGDDLMTPVAEVTPAEEVSDAAEIERAVEAELGFYTPLYRKRQDKFGSMLIGPVAQTSIARIDGVDRFTRRYYGGLRFAYSPETWLDLTYGKSEGIDGRRAEIRGQWPLTNISGDSRLFLGAIINLGVKNSGDEPDSFRLYVTWNTGFSNLFRSK